MAKLFSAALCPKIFRDTSVYSKTAAEVQLESLGGGRRFFPAAPNGPLLVKNSKFASGAQNI
jgi:hypothetical protein